MFSSSWEIIQFCQPKLYRDITLSMHPIDLYFIILTMCVNVIDCKDETLLQGKLPWEPHDHGYIGKSCKERI